MRQIIGQHELLHKLSQHEKVIIPLNQSKHLSHKKYKLRNRNLNFYPISMRILSNLSQIRYSMSEISIKTSIFTKISTYSSNLPLWRKIDHLPCFSPVTRHTRIRRKILQRQNISLPIGHLNMILLLQS